MTFKNIRNMSVRTKLIIGFSVIVVLIWLIAVFTSTGYRNLNQQFMNVEESVISETLVISNIESLASETYRGILDYLFHGSEEAKLNSLSLLDLLIRIEESNLSPGEEIDQQLITAIDQYHIAINNIIATKDSGASFEDLLVMDQRIVLPALVTLQQAVTDQNLHNSEQLAIAKADFSQTYYTGLHSMLVTVAVITLVALIAALLTTKSILNPLKKLRKGTEMVAKGNLSYKVGTKATDEIGQLSRDFDRMTEGLKTTMTSIDNLNTEIIERKKVEAALQKSEEKFRVLFESAKDAIFLADTETGVLIDVNRAGCDLLDLPKEKIIGMHQSQIHPEGTADKYKELFREHIEKGNTISEDMLVQRADGTQVPVDISASLVELDGKPTMQGVFRDITSRKQAEEELRINEERFRLIADNSTDLVSRIQMIPEISTDYVSPSCLRITGYKQEEFYSDPNLGLEMIHPEDREFFTKHVTSDNRKDQKPITVRVVRKDGQIIWIEQTHAVISNDQGETIAMHLIARDITERKRAEATIRESEEKFSVAFRSNPHPMSISSMKSSKFIEVNDSFTRVTGYTRDEVIGRSAEDLNLWVNNDDRKTILETLKEEGRVDSLEYLLRTKSGEILTLLFSAEPITILGEKCMISVTTDITKRKKAEEDLRESQEFNNSLLEKAPHQILVINPDTSIRYVNPKFEEVNGWTLDEIVGMKAPYPWWTEELFTEEAIEQFKEAINMDIGQVEIIARKKNGEHYWLDLNWVGVKRDDELQYCLISSTDITERKKMDEALKESEEKFSKAFRSSPNAIVITTIAEGKFVDVNDSFIKLTGYTREEIIGNTAENLNIWANIKDRAKMLRILKRDGSVLNHEYNFRIKSGEIRTWLFSAELIDIGDEPCNISMNMDITEQKRAVAALRESEEFSSSLMRNSAIPILVINEDTSLRYVNPAFEKLTGFSSAEVVGKKSPMPWWTDDLDLEDTGKYKESILKGVSGKERLFQKKNGEKFWVEVTSAPVKRDGKFIYSLSNWLDITERKQAEEALANEVAWRRILVEQSRDGIVILDQNSKVYEANRRFGEILGYSPEEVHQLYVWDWDSQHTQEQILEMIRDVDEEGDHFETGWQRKDGTNVDVEISTNGAIFGGQKFIFCVCRDTTERKQMENELRVHRDHLEELVRERTAELTELNKRLQHELKERQKAEVALLAAKEEAETANQSKSEFLARTSHEIRTPIHGVLGTINLVLDSKLEHDQRQYLKMAISSAEALLNIINDILDLSKIEAGQLEPEQEVFNLRTTLEDTLDSMAVTAHNKGLELTCHLLDGVTTDLVGDPRHLRQVLINLIGNSIKFTEKGEVALYVETIADSKKETELCFTVRDTGIGIPKNKSNMIFEPFQQADGSINRKYGGTGLGLTISRHLIEQMGGRIWVEKVHGKGSVFHFTCKFTKQTAGKYSGNGSKSTLNVRNVPLLLVDDNVTNRMMVKDMLVKWGFDVTDVDSGASALKVISDSQAKSVKYRIIMLDKTMDGMDGFAVAEQMLNDSTMPSDIIMMLPPHSVSDDFSRCQKLGISNYVIKPIKESELEKSLLTAMGKLPDSKQKTEKTNAKQSSVPGLHILVAEDNSTSQLIARKTLEKMGHHVEIAQNGSEAVKMTETGNFDLIFMDAEMPVLNGLEATRLIRKSERASGRHIPIIAMTAYAMKEDKKKCLAAGMDAYLSKPAKPEDINAIVAKLFAGKERAVKKKPVGTSASFSESEVKEMPTVDMQAAMKVFGDDNELLREAVGLFLEEDYPQQIKLLKEGIERLDAAAVRAAAHSIKGAARSLGGMVLGDVALRLEKLGSEGKLKDVEELASKLEDELKHFADYYSQSASN